MYTVYCHVFPNGKRYVGITKSTLTKRWRSGKGYGSCALVNKAIQKYEWDNILHETLCSVESVTEAEEWERFYIRKWDTCNPCFGYNILPGGDVSQNEPTEEMRVKLGNGWRGKRRSDSERQSISAGLKSVFSRPESNGHFGMTATDETKSKMAASQKAAWSESRRASASARMKTRMSDMTFRSRVVNNLQEQPKRKKGEWVMPESAKQKLKEVNKGKWVGSNSSSSKPVLQYTKSGEFVARWDNACEVERAGIASRSNVAKCCRGVEGIHTVAGYVWKYE